MSYIDRINIELSSVGSDLEKGVLLARKAAYLARMGVFDQSHRIVADLRSTPNIYQLPIIPIWLTLVDGVSLFFRGYEDDAKDRWQRTKALSAACHIREMEALASAWLAHFAFGRFDWQALRRELSCTFSAARSDDTDCLARAFLVLGETAHLAGRREVANVWYSRSRAVAQSVGDELTVSSLIFNTAAMQIVNYRQQIMAFGGREDVAALAVIEAESTSNFDELVGVSSLAELTPVLKAQALSLSERFAEAESIYAEALRSPPSGSQARNRGWLLADRAYCVAKLGLFNLSDRLTTESLKWLTDRVQVDDMAALHSRLAEVFKLLNKFDKADYHAQEAKRFWGEFSDLQARMIDICNDFEYCGAQLCRPAP